MYEIKLLQINLGHRRAASYDLQLRTNKLKDFITLVQEPWISRGGVKGLNNHHKMIVAPAGDKPRAMSAACPLTRP